MFRMWPAYEARARRRQSREPLPLPSCDLHLKGRRNIGFRGSPYMQIRFADSRPDGDYALVLPVAGKDRGSPGVARRCAEARFGSAAIASVSKARRPAPRSISLTTGAARAAFWSSALARAPRRRTRREARRHGCRPVADVRREDRGDRPQRPRLRCRCGGPCGIGRGTSRVALRSLSHEAQGQSEADTEGGVDRRRRTPAPRKRYEQRWAPVVEGVSLTRELVTEPANIIYPESFVERVRASVEGLGLEIEVLDRAAMDQAWHGRACSALRRVRSAKPDCWCCKWTGGGKGAPPVAFVGKGVTFDTGGISIKPAAGMEAMKWDMGGAGAVVGAMKALGAAQGQGQHRRHLRAGRKHARRQCPASRRRGHHDVGPDRGSHQHRRRRAPRAGRRGHLRRSATTSRRRSSTSRR